MVNRAELQKWVRQDRIDRGEIAGVSTGFNAQLRRKRSLTRQLEAELSGREQLEGEYDVS